MTTKEIVKTARIAGLLYLIVFIAALFATFVKSSLVVPGDAAATVSNIMASESLFRLGFVSDLTHQAVQVVLVLVLYKLLRPVSKAAALLMAIFGLVGVPIAMLNMLNHSAALLLLSGADYLTAFTADQLQALVMFFLDLLDHGFFIAFIPWGIWLFPLGYLVIRSGCIPRILGILLIVAGFGYLIDFVTFFLFPNFDATVRMFTFWGELFFALWLLIKGVNVEQWEKRALESA